MQFTVAGRIGPAERTESGKDKTAIEASMSEDEKAFADSIGVVHVRFEGYDPPVVGAMCLHPSADAKYGVRFLVPSNRDLARAVEKNMVGILRREIEAELSKRQLPGALSSLGVELSSLEAEGIRAPRFEA
jgi:hypothetical protein